MSAQVPQVICRVFDQFGNPLDMLEVRAPRSWLLNDVGQCVFSLSVRDPHCTERNLRYGNLVLVQSAGLPDWVGVIDPPRGRNYGSVTVTAYSAEYLLKLRLATNVSSAAAASGVLFQKLITGFSEKGGTTMTPNVEWEGKWQGTIGTNGSDPVATFWEWIDKMKLADTCDWNVLPYFADGSNNLKLRATWTKSIGKTRMDYLIDESNSALVTTAGIEEQGPFANEVLGVAQAPSYGRYWVLNADSVALYGPHDKLVNVNGYDAAYIQSVAMANLCNPVRKYTIAVDNRGALWGQVALGDTVRVRYGWGGFYDSLAAQESYVRITGLSVDEMAGQLVFVAEEI